MMLMYASSIRRLCVSRCCRQTSAVVTSVPNTTHVEGRDRQEHERIHAGGRPAPAGGRDRGRGADGDHRRRERGAGDPKAAVHGDAARGHQRGLRNEQDHPGGEQRAVEMDQPGERPAADRRLRPAGEETKVIARTESGEHDQCQGHGHRPVEQPIVRGLAARSCARHRRGVCDE